MATPYWHRLLKHFENKGYINNGLTIPFLIGSLEIVDPKAKLWTIDSMIDSLNEIGCTILKCPGIKEFVIGSIDSETLKHRQLYHNPCKNIFVTDSSLDNVNSCEEITNLFNELYQLRLDNRKFSKNQGIWTYFTDTDLKIINEVI